MSDARSVDEIRADLAAVKDEQYQQYWLFTRCARGKPVDPNITRRRCRLEAELAEAMEALKHG